MRFRACTIDSSLQGPRSFIGVVALVLCRATMPFGCRTGRVPGIHPCAFLAFTLAQTGEIDVRTRQALTADP